MTKDWFKFLTVVYEKEDKCYVKATSSFFDKFIFSWQGIASKMYPLRVQWMKETGKNVPEPMLEMNKIIKTLTTNYDEITHILEELACGCYFDDVESIIGATTDQGILRYERTWLLWKITKTLQRLGR